MTGIRRKTPNADRTAAIIHTTDDRRLTAMPSRVARSPFSAAALMAMPMSVKRKNAARPTAMSATTTTMNSAFPSKITGWIVKWMDENGVFGGAGSTRKRPPIHLGR